MNNKEILNLLDEFVIEKNLQKDFSIIDLTTNLEGSTSSQIVFYNIRDDINAKEQFKKRFQQANGPLLITNTRPPTIDENYIVIPTDKFFLAQKKLLDFFYPLNRDKLKIIGITGTNGKSSVVHLSMHISNILGHKALCLGTLGAYDLQNALVKTFKVTSPSYVELRKILNLASKNYEVIFMEISSHALSQKRLFDIELDLGAWMNISQDHLDYHKTMDGYFKAKLLIIENFIKKNHTIFIPFNELELFKKIETNLKNYNPKKIKLSKTKKINSYKNLFTKKEFNHGFMKTNLEMALSLNFSLWKNFDTLDLSTLSPPKGRFSKIEINEATVIIDYAHTPDAIFNILKATMLQFPEQKISILFGCGGDRDRSKRALMGKIACENANKLYITSDNPRTENPKKIIKDILKGVAKKTNFEVITDRKDAIKKAIRDISKGEILILAGKGHETYQEINGVKKDFDEFKIVEDLKND